MRTPTRDSLYRHEVRRGATEGVIDAIDRVVLLGGPRSARSDAVVVAGSRAPPPILLRPRRSLPRCSEAIRL